MSRSLSSAAVLSLTAPATGEAWLWLLTFSHAGLATPICLTSDAVPTVSNGVTYEPLPFSLTLPAEQEERPPRIRLSVDNVARTLVTALRSLIEPPTLTVAVVLGSSPNVVEVGPLDFRLEAVTFDATSISAELSYERILDQAYPCDAFTPNLFPGLF